MDFVIEEYGQLIGIEVKSGPRKGQRDKKYFLKQFPDAQFFLITLENFQECENDINRFLGL